MNREQATFGIGGTAFGFVAGFVLAYALTAPATIDRVPMPPPPAMGGAAGSPTAAADQENPHGDIMGVLANLNERLEEEPENVEVLLELAQIYLRAGMAEQAVSYLERLQKVEPGHYQARLYTAMAMEGMGRGHEAHGMLESMVVEDPERWEPHYMLALHFLNDPPDVARARQALDRVEALNPEMPSLPGLRQEAERLEAEGRSGTADPG